MEEEIEEGIEGETKKMRMEFENEKDEDGV